MLAFEMWQPHNAAGNHRSRGVSRVHSCDSEAASSHASPQHMPGTQLHHRRSGPDPFTGWVKIVALCTLAILICYADRSNISVAIVPMSEEFTWSDSYKGTVLSVFFIGYAATQLLGGALADRYGGKGVLAIGLPRSSCWARSPAA